MNHRNFRMIQYLTSTYVYLECVSRFTAKLSLIPKHWTMHPKNYNRIPTHLTCPNTRNLGRKPALCCHTGPLIRSGECRVSQVRTDLVSHHMSISQSPGRMSIDEFVNLSYGESRIKLKCSYPSGFAIEQTSIIILGICRLRSASSMRAKPTTEVAWFHFLRFCVVICCPKRKVSQGLGCLRRENRMGSYYFDVPVCIA